MYAADKSKNPETVRLTLRRLVQRLVDVCNAIEYAHSRGVLHRDLKPGNIMLGKYGETLVVDWGLAKTGSKTSAYKFSDEATFVPSSGDTSNETRLGTVVGTPAYMSPEQAEGDPDALGPASDVYSLGATLYSILTGQPPVPRLPRQEIILRVMKGQIEDPGKVNPDAPRALVAVCKKAMSLAPKDRYPTATDLAQDLELWLADEPVSAYQEPFVDRMMRAVRRHRTLVTSTTAVLLTALVALLALNVQTNRKNRELAVARDEAQASEQRAVDQRDRAEKNLKLAQSLSITLWSVAEEELSVIPSAEVVAVRRKFTEAAYSGLKQLLTSSPDNYELMYEYARVARVSSNLLRFYSEMDKAQTRLDESLEWQLKIPEDKRLPKYKSYLAQTYREISTLIAALGKLTEARAEIAKGRAIAEELRQLDSLDPGYKRDMAMLDLEEGGIDGDQLITNAALDKLRRAANTLRELALSPKKERNDSALWCLTLARQIKINLDGGRTDEAIRTADSVLETLSPELEKNPKDNNLLIAVLRAHTWKAEALAVANKDLDTAKVLAAKATAMCRALLKQREAPAYQRSICETLRVEAQIARLQGDPDAADQYLRESKEVMEKLLASSDLPVHHELLALTLDQYALLKKSLNEIEAAKQFWKDAIEQQTQACKMSPESKLSEHILALITANAK